MKTDLGCPKEKNRFFWQKKNRLDFTRNRVTSFAWLDDDGQLRGAFDRSGFFDVSKLYFFVAILWFFLQHEFPVLQHFLPIVQSPTSRLKCQRGQMLIFYKIPWVYLRLLGKWFSFGKIFDKKGKFFVELTNLSTLFKNWFQTCWLSPPQLLSWPLAAMDRWHLLILWIFQIFYFRSLLPPPFEGSDSFK